MNFTMLLSCPRIDRSTQESVKIMVYHILERRKVGLLPDVGTTAMVFVDNVFYCGYRSYILKGLAGLILLRRSKFVLLDRF